MRKIYFLLFTVFSLLAATQGLFAQTVTIGAGASTQRYPLHYWYGYGRNSTIYTAAEMGTTGGPASVVSIAYFTTIAANTGPTVVYFREVGSATTQTSMTWANKIAGATQVYSGTPAIGVANAWRVITLTTPFPLNPNQNLEIMIECNFGGGGTGVNAGNAIRYSSVANSFQYWEADTNPPLVAGTVTGNRPNIQMVLGPPIPCVPGSLSGGVATGPLTPVCAGINFALSATGGSFGSGLTYQWESSPTGSAPWTAVTGGAAASISTSTLTNMYYRRKTTCSGTDAYTTNNVLVTVSPLQSIPFTENFAGYTTTFPPACWTNGNPTYIAGAASSAYGTGSGSTRFNFYNATGGTNLDLVTSVFTPVPAGYRLTFDHAYATYSGESDNLEILYSTNGGASYTSLILYLGGTSGPLNTGGTVGNFTQFVPSAAQWATKGIALPVGTNRLIFRGISGFGNNLFVDNITVEPTPSCLPPATLGASAITTTTATVSWAAPTPAPASGYQWEIRTSGAGGSGATGLITSGSTAAGTVSANATGLTANTAYNLYVRSNCGVSNFSTWAGPYAFRTTCNAVTVFPFTETFEDASPTRSCWGREIVSGAFNWTYGAGAGNGGPVTTSHGGTLNAQYFGNTYGAEQARLVSPELNLSGMPNGADLEFWYINPSWLGDINELRVYYKTSAAGSWTLIPGAVYTTGVGAWTKIELINLPNINSTYYIAFEGTQLFGYGIGIDDVVVKAGPSCRKPTNVSAIGISPTSAVVSFTSPGNAFIVEYGAPGFTPGTTNTAGTGGTLVLGAASPITISTGLAANTTYDVYVRRVCTPGVDYSENVKSTFTTLCAATNIPYVQDFETSVPAVGLPSCTSMQDVNGNSGPDPNVTGGRWVTYQGTTNQVYVSPTKSIRYLYDFVVPTRGADDWFYIQGLNLTGGTSYRLKFFYKGSDGPNWFEKLEVKYGTSAINTAMTNTIYSNTNILTALASPWDSARVDFTPATTGVYYIGFHAISDPDQAFLYMDDISVRIAPLVDAGATGITGIPTCPGSTATQATITNYNLTTLNFATYPVTVTASMTGASTGSVSTTLNTGTLAAGASMTVNLPAFNFVAGVYNITVKTASPSDPETGNDSYSTIAYVNPTPVAAVVTPAAPAICAGSSVQLSTQFVTPPAAPVTMPAVSSGTLNTPFIDNSPNAGITHSLTVSGVPATATVTGISVTLNAAHTWNADLIFNLRAPNGKILNLANRKGGQGDGYTNAVISSAGTDALPTGNVTITGTYAADAASGVGPAGFVSNAGGFAELMQAGNGTWTLIATDNANLDFGSLTSWSITITYATPHPAEVTWSPVTGLFTNAAMTNPYTAGTTAYSVYAKPAATTTYTVTTKSAAGCITTSTVTVTVNPNPVVAIGNLPVRICISDSLVALTATPAGGTWSGIGVSGSNFVPPATAVGSYTLSYTSTNTFGCTTVGTTVAKVEECPERLILLRDNAVILFPNPNNGRFNVRINSTLYNKLTMRVYTANGTLVRTQQFSGLVFGRVIPVDLSSMPSGSYMVQFASDNSGVRTSEKAFKVIVGR